MENLRFIDGEYGQCKRDAVVAFAGGVLILDDERDVVGGGGVEQGCGVVDDVAHRSAALGGGIPDVGSCRGVRDGEAAGTAVVLRGQRRHDGNLSRRGGCRSPFAAASRGLVVSFRIDGAARHVDVHRVTAAGLHRTAACGRGKPLYDGAVCSHRCFKSHLAGTASDRARYGGRVGLWMHGYINGENTVTPILRGQIGGQNGVARLREYSVDAVHGEGLSLAHLSRVIEMINWIDGQIEGDHGVADLPIVQVNGI